MMRSDLFVTNTVITFKHDKSIYNRLIRGHGSRCNLSNLGINLQLITGLSRFMPNKGWMMCDFWK